MWRRLSVHLRTLGLIRSTPKPKRFHSNCFIPCFGTVQWHEISTASRNVTSLKRVENIMSIATGHEREELQAELEETPSVIKSFHDKRIVGCPALELKAVPVVQFCDGSLSIELGSASFKFGEEFSIYEKKYKVLYGIVAPLSPFVLVCSSGLVFVHESNHEDPLNLDAAAVLRDNPKMFESNIRRAMAGGYVGQSFFNRCI